MLHYLAAIYVTLCITSLSTIYFIFRKIFQLFKPYEAPLERRINPENAIPGSYVIRLRPGHSLEKHSMVTGFDVGKHKYASFRPELMDGRTIYLAKDVDSKMLAAIRADKGVISVSPDHGIIPEPFPVVSNPTKLPKVRGKTVPWDYVESDGEGIHKVASEASTTEHHAS